MQERLHILQIWVDAVDMPAALKRIRRFVCEGNRPHSVFAANPEKNFSVPRDPDLWETFRQADLIIPDGVGMVLAARLLYGVRFSRVPGVELMEQVCAMAAREGFKVFLFGAREEVSRGAAEILQARYPGLAIVGRQNGYVDTEKMPELIDRINASQAQILFLALGSPRQERWFVNHRHQLHSVRVCQGIGGTLDTITGDIKRAPAIWRRYGGEWLYRLLSEPQRIRRQKVLPLFAVQVLGQRLRRFLAFGATDGPTS